MREEEFCLLEDYIEAKIRDAGPCSGIEEMADLSYRRQKFIDVHCFGEVRDEDDELPKAVELPFFGEPVESICKPSSVQILEEVHELLKNACFGLQIDPLNRNNGGFDYFPDYDMISENVRKAEAMIVKYHG